MAKDKPEEKTLENLDAIEQELNQTPGGEDTPEGGIPDTGTPVVQPPKKRKKRAKKEPEPLPELDAGETSAMLGWLFDMISQRAGEHWKLTKKESDQGAIVINKVMLKYLPVVGKYGEEVALLMWSVTVILPRWQIAGQTKPEPVLE